MAAQLAYSGVPSVEPEAKPPDSYQRSSAATPEAFGAAIGRGVEQLGAGAEKAGKFFGQVAADNAANDFQDFSTKLLHGDPNKTVTGADGQPMPDPGYMGLKGRAALDARPRVEEALASRIKEIRAGLQTPEQQLQFDNISRRYHNGVRERIGSHSDQQSNVWYAEVNGATYDLSRNHIATSPDDPEAFAHGTSDMIASAVKNAELKGAQPGDAVWMQAVETAKRDALKTQVQAIGVGDPVRALKVLDSNREIAGVEYTPLANALRVRANQQTGQDAGARAIAQTGYRQPTVLPAGGVANVPSAAVHNAILMQESGGNLNERTSVNGAVGVGQIMPETFRQYAKPGESISNPQDNLAVSRRIIEDYYKRYSGDPARVAVAYFSGPGNVAPPGSPTPYLRNAADGNGKTTASYVNDINNRLSKAAITDAKANAYRLVMDNPELNHEQRQYALSDINQRFTADQITADADLRAKKEANEHAMNGYVTRILTGDTKGIAESIPTDPDLDAHTKMYLIEALKKKTGDDVEDATHAYGRGFWGAYKAVTAPVGDPARIADATLLLSRAGPDGDLTLAGVQKLSQVLQQNQKSVNDAAVNHAKVGLLNYARNKLSYEGELTQMMIAAGLPARRDPNGEAIFNGVFIPKFEAAYDKWVKDGKDPWEFLTQENVEKLRQGLRSKAQMDMDRVAGEGGVSNVAVPPPPQGVPAPAWQAIMATRPVVGGKAVHPNSWAAAIEQLRKEPTAENIAYFNEAFPNFDANTILQRLPPTAPTVRGPR